MRNGRRSDSRRDLLSTEIVKETNTSKKRGPNKRTEPKPLPLITSNLSYSAYLRYQDVNAKHTPEPTSRRKQNDKIPKLQRKESERYKDDNTVVVNDNAVKSDGKSANNLNPFHHDFNKVIENPFLKAQELSLTTETTDDNTDAATDVTNLSSNLWAGGRGETVNTGIVDLYDDHNEGCDPFLKMRVVVLSSVLMVQLVAGFTKMLVNLNFLSSNSKLSLTQLSVPLHMSLLGGVTSSLVLPGLLLWSRVKALSVCCMLAMITSTFTIFSHVGWLSRLAEFTAGLAAGLTAPLLHTYSGEVFTARRRERFALLITLLGIFGELVSAVTCYFFSIETAAWLSLALCVPCLVSTSCFAPDPPRFLLYRGHKTACVDSLQWLRGSSSDLAGEFSQLSARLEAALGYRSVVRSLRHRAVYAPVLLCAALASLSSVTSLHSLGLLAASAFAAHEVSAELVMADTAVRGAGAVVAVLLHTRMGIKMLLLLGLALSSAVSLFLALLSHLTLVTVSVVPGQVTIAVLGLASSLVAGPRWLVCLDLAPVHHLPWALALAAAILSSLDLVTVMTFPLAVQNLSVSVSVMAWTGALGLGLAYVTALWLLPDLRPQELGGVEEHFRSLFDGSHNVKLTGATTKRDPES